MMPMSERDPALLARGERPLSLVVHDRHIEQRLAAEERERQPLRLQLVEPLLDPRRQPGAVVERHPVGVLVVVAVVALEAVVAGEVALQRRQHRHAHLLGVFAEVREELVQRLGVGRAARHDEPVLGERDQRFARIGCRAARARATPDRRKPIEQPGDVLGDDQLRVGQRVHQEHLAAIGEWDTNVEHRLLHSSKLVAGWLGRARRPESRCRVSDPSSVFGSRRATAVPANSSQKFVLA